MQFRAEYCERHLPTEEDAILRYLSSGAVKGIGQATAIRIVEKFGRQALEVLEKGAAAADRNQGDFSLPKRPRSRRNTHPNSDCGRCCSLFPDTALLRAKRSAAGRNGALPRWNAFGRIPTYSAPAARISAFERADQICMGMDRPADDPRRIEAGLLYILRHNLNGHTCLPADKLAETGVALLGVEPALVNDTLESMLASFTVKEETFDGRRFIFLNHLHRAEKYCAARIRL